MRLRSSDVQQVGVAMAAFVREEILKVVAAHWSACEADQLAWVRRDGRPTNFDNLSQACESLGTGAGEPHPFFGRLRP